MTEEDPPYNFTGKDGQPTGFAVDLTREIQKRTGNSDPITIKPWARAYTTIQTSPDIVLFTMARTDERENLFQWVGPIYQNKWVFIVKADAPYVITALEDAKKLTSIGVVRDFASERYLTAQGFTNLDQITQNSQNVRKLRLGRIQAYVSSDNTWKSEILSEGFNPVDFRVLYAFYTINLYIAHSASTDPDIVLAWQKALDTMKQDGTYTKICNHWFPSEKN